MVKKSKTFGGLRSLPKRRPSEDYDLPPDDAKFPPLPPGTRLRVPRGRPKGITVGDPADFRTARFGMRIHPDLKEEIEAQARKEGFRFSQWIERVLVDGVNRARGREVLDKIGRRYSRE